MFSASTYNLFGDITLTVHLLYVSFVVFAQIYIIIGWFKHWPLVRNFIFRMIHLGMIVVVTIQELLGVECPLTTLENHFRRQAGMSVDEQTTFIMRLVFSVVFIDIPRWVFSFVYIGFGAVVILTLIYLPPIYKTRKSNTPPLQNS